MAAEGSLPEILYETRHHASRPYSCYPPLLHQQPNEGIKGSFLSLLSTRGVSQLKEKWSEYRHPQKLKKWTSLFISPRCERVAIAVGNQITILQKDDDYRDPCGLFTGSYLATFVCGAWSEGHDILGVTDDTDTLYFIRANGEEITRITKRHLKGSLPIISVIAEDDTDIKNSCLCTFSILTSDGSLHDIEISRDPSASISTTHSSNNGSILKKQFPQNVFCLDYRPESLLLAVVSGSTSISSTATTGFYGLSLWKRTMDLDLKPVTSTQFEGLYSKPKGYVGQLTSPKTQISPQGKFVATLDLRGCLVTFKLDEDQSSVSQLSFEGKYELQGSNTSTRERQSLNNLVDFSWWSDHILTIANRSGSISMIDVVSGVKLLENDPVYSMPILERAQHFPGRLFLLESVSSEESCGSSDILLMESATAEKYKQFDSAKLRWSLISFYGRSVPEMYDALIGSQKYQAALDFADRHGLDRDEVLKAQWLHSLQGPSEINKLLLIIKDEAFVLSECVNRVAPTEDAVRALLAYGLRLTNHYIFNESEDDECRQTWDFRLTRLKLLQFRDRLETFLGINMGRFSVEDYSKFRTSPINETAVALAESGKIGALNLLFKRHPYSLAPFMLKVLAAIPETVPVQTYGQLLPGNSPPSNALREEDWVECEEMIKFINRLPNNYENDVQIRTEPIVKRLLGLRWPSINDLSVWYTSRARDIDELSGQLDNCLSLVDFACRKGISELQKFHENISYLEQLIYSADNDDEMNFTMSLAAWERLSHYEKFKMMLRGVKEENVIKRLSDKAIPFMQKRADSSNEDMDNSIISEKRNGSFLVRWLKEIAKDNKLDICLIVIEEGCKEFVGTGLFRNEVEAVDCAIQLIYLCTTTDRWSTMASMLSKLPPLQDPEVEGLRKRLKLVQGHIEAGRLLAFYQVPKPIDFFLEAHSDEKGVKQILRLILSKFARRQPGRTDNDWANMWRDLQCLQEKAFPFVDLEYMLMEFCRGLLKAGKFSLARNYLKGSGSVALATDKAENLVIQAAREYFFSASSLSCSEIWKAKECLNIFPSSRNVRVEADIIDALTNKLPMLGVNLLPMQFRQIKDPMEIIKLAITSQGGVYLNVDELIEVSKLLGLSSQDDISAVQEAIAREAAVAGDLQLAFDLCLVLAKKGHGSIWDLCAALARGPALENMDISSRKQLLGFSLSHCDEESISELLNAWKDLDMQGQCERLAMLTGKDPPKFLAHGSTIISYPLHISQDTDDLRDWSGQVDGIACDDQEVYLSTTKNKLSGVAKSLSAENGSDWESLLRENGKVLAFVALRLPWLLELIQEAGSGKKFISSSVSGKLHASVRTQAVVTILSWLARNGFAPRDNLIASLTKSIIEPPVTEEEDILGCSFLLNLVDAFHGVEIIEEQVKNRNDYIEINSIMNVGVIYSLLHNSGAECENPGQRKELLLRKFREKLTLLSSDERDKIGKTQSSFWREWKLKLEEQKRVADHTRVIEQIIPGVEAERFLSRDICYMESVVFSLVESVKMENKRILKDVLRLAYTYGLDPTKVLLKLLGSVLVSEVWTIDDIESEISEFKIKILDCAGEAIKMISVSVYPEIDGCNKPRLAYIYGLLSECYLKVEETKESLSMIGPDLTYGSTHGLANFCKTVEQECSRVSFIEDLNFKNIAGLRGLNIECFSSEVDAHINEKTVEALAEMVETLVGICGDPVPDGLVPWQHVYSQHVATLLTVLETRAKTEHVSQNPKKLLCFINELVQTYDKSRKYIRVVGYPGVVDIMKRFITVILTVSNSFDNLSSDLTWKDSLVVLLNFWVRLTEDMQEFVSHKGSEESFCPSCLTMCLKVFVNLVMEGKVSPGEGWCTVFTYINIGLTGNLHVEIFNFCRSMILSGCRFKAIADVFAEVISQFPPCSASISNTRSQLNRIMDLSHLYVGILETILLDSASGSLEHKNLHIFLSSLSKVEGDLEELKKVRRAVWESMAKFSDNLQLPSHVRVYTLELMQFIAGTGRTLSMFSTELQVSVLPWDGWDDMGFKSSNSDTPFNSEAPKDTSNRFTNTLVALKSSQLVSAISSGMEITPEDLLTVGSAVSCFSKVSGAAVSESHVDVLVAILGEWEGLFVDERERDVANLAESVDAGNDWGNDDWDEGWESFQEESDEKETKQLDTLLVHPLHACWLEICKRLISFSRFGDMLKLIDQSIAKRNGVLLDEDDARSLSETLVDANCFIALKIVLLLPYEGIQMEYLDSVEGKLKQGGIPDAVGGDHEFLLLILSSGLLSTIINKPSYGTVFSYLCYMVGNMSRQCQVAQLSSLKDLKTNEKDLSYFFSRILFPGFVSELVKGDQQILAGFLVVKFMHTNASFSLINVAEASLRWYLEKQLEALPANTSNLKEMSLVNTVVGLRSKLENLILSALQLLAETDGR